MLATRVQLLPDVVDFTIVLSGSGAGGFGMALVGAALRFGPDRLGRFVMFGNLLGGVLFGIIYVGVLLGSAIG